METILTILQGLYAVLNWLAVHVPWEAVAASGILSGLLVGPQKWIKKNFVHNEPVMITVVGIAGFLVVLANYLLHIPTTDPSVMALQALALSFATQPFYFIIVKPLRGWLSTQLAAAAAYKKEVLSAAEPETGVPGPGELPPKIGDVEMQEFTH